MTNFFSQILNSKIFKNLIFAVLLGIVVLSLTSFLLKIYTKHDQKIFTPSFKGLTVQEAETLAKEKKIRITVIDSVYEAYGQPGTVIDQTPKANFMIKQDRNIFLTIKSASKKIIKMPNLRSVSLIQARAEIESNSLKIGNIEYRPSDYHDLVIEQKTNDKIIEPGSEIEAGSEIDLIVGQSTGSEAIVPKLNGLTEMDASFRAAEYSLNIGNMNYDNTVITEQDSLEAVVWKQSHPVNSVVEPGTEIEIWLTTEPNKYK